MANLNSASFSFRLAPSVKAEAFSVIEHYGLTPSQVLNVFLTQIANTKRIPVDLSYLEPNVTTLRSMQDAEEGNVEMIEPSDMSIAEALLKVPDIS
ncbi:type II toxin-antitoxin system RelB/DinJ family antitoxin [Pelistega ratti]|uniref:type II toxin-antitoxin system RelB/DinJ family antitoxin n=1 Tax=Pelistega ratti TaxID=2652177 RepID=UPI0013573469|nr:type II toxin-antitoxin system RelB/DinJ family antitoxin [Pelistega ratti]